METSRFVTIIMKENGDHVILNEFNDLQEGFKAFNELDLNQLNEDEGDEGYELVKYDEDDMALDWTDEELNSIGWELNTWVILKQNVERGQNVA